MSLLASALYLAAAMQLARAASSVPVATQPVVATSIVTTGSDALSTTISTFVSASTIVLYSTLFSGHSFATTSIGETVSTVKLTTTIVASAPGTELSTIISTIGSTTLYSVESSTSLPSSAPAQGTSTSTSIATAPVVATQTQANTPVDYVTSTASVSSLSTGLPNTVPAAATTAVSTSTATPEKSSKKKLSGGAAAGIAIAVLLAIGGIAGALFIFIGKRREQKKWGRKAALNETEGESKTNLFSPDARAGYDSMWEKPAGFSGKEIRPGTITPSEARSSHVSHERGDSSTLGMDSAPAPIVRRSMANTTNIDPFGVDALRKPATNFSTPDRRSGSMGVTARPYI